MFEIIKKTITHEISVKDFLIHLQFLQRTEDDIHQYSKLNDISMVKIKAEQRTDLIKNLRNEIKEFEKILKTKSIKIENKEQISKVQEYLIKIEKILKQQLNELNKQEILNDNLLRTKSIHGDLKDKNGNDTDSYLTIQLKELSNLLREQSEIVLKFVVEASNKIQEIKINSEKFKSIYDYNFHVAFRKALELFGEKRLLSSSEIIKAKINLNEDHFLWNGYVINTYTEENIGIDKEGIFYENGTPVLITVHGGGILTPERIGLNEGMYVKYFDNNGNSTGEFENLLKGILPNGEKIKLFKYEQIEKGVKNLPHRYAIVTPFDLITKSQKPYHDYNEKEFLSNPLAITRAGGKELLVKYHGRVIFNRRFNKREFGSNNKSQSQHELICSHSFEQDMDFNKAKGFIVTIGGKSELSNIVLNYEGTFVGRID